MSEICTACDVRGFTTCKIDCLCSYGNPMIPTWAEAERPKVELPPMDDNCVEDAYEWKSRSFPSDHTITECQLVCRERQLLASLSEIAELKAFIETKRMELIYLCGEKSLKGPAANRVGQILESIELKARLQK